MKFFYMILVMYVNFMMLCSTQASQSTYGPEAVGTIHIHVNTANTAQSSASPVVNQNTFQSVDQQAIVGSKCDMLDQYYNQLQKIVEEKIYEMQGLSTSLLGWMCSNKIKTIGLAMILSYAYLQWQIIAANKIIMDPSSWSNWRHTDSLEQLLSIPQAQIESDLLFAIQTKFVHPDRPTDFIFSIVQSLQSLKEEIVCVKEQLTRFQWLEKCRCLSLFFIDEDKVSQTIEQHRKLLFMQHIFLSWCAQYKINKNH